jgi:hypothetical protein
MKAGRDVDGLWTHLEAGIGCVPVQLQSVYLVTSYSIAAILSNVPYSFPLFTSLTGKKSSLVRVRQFCRDRALERLRVGAKRKDLFYYLVSSHTRFLASSSHKTR